MPTILRIIYFLFPIFAQNFACDHYDPSEGRPYSTTVCSYLQSLSNISVPESTPNLAQYLEITQSNIPTIPKSTFSKFITITKLYLTRNHIKIIEPGAFDSLTIKELYLDLNQLTEVSKGVFNSLTQLEILNLANNRIESIEKGAFDGLENLLEVNLENNQLRRIEGHLFASPKYLQLIDLSGNPLEQFEGEGISSLSALILAETNLTDFCGDLKNLHLEILNLSSSYLTQIDFARFPKVGKIYLSNNELVTISNLERLDSDYVSLDFNRIITINGSFNDVSFVTLKHNQLEVVSNTFFDESAKAFFIDLSYNLISLVEKDAFRNLTMLQILHLEYNKISFLDPKVFADLMELKYLDLSHNKIQDIPYGTFDNLIQLKVLNVSDNKLKTLHESGLISVVSLEELIFHNNKVEYLDVEILAKYKSQLKIISLNHNAWDCESVASTYVEFMQKHDTLELVGLSEEGENFHGIACSSKQNNAWEDSDMNKFFNGDFKKSKFFQYFEKDYTKSDFFKFLNGYNGGRGGAERLVANNMSTVRDSTNRILLFSVVLQAMIVAGLVLNFWRRTRAYHV